MRQRAWPVLVVVAILLAGVPMAGAAKQPPRAKLRANGDSLRIGSSTWSWSNPTGFWPGGGECVITISDGIRDYGPGLALDHDHARPRVVFLRAHRPRIQSFKAYQAIKKSDEPWGDEPIGPGKRVRSRLRAKRSGGEIVAWALKFRVNIAKRPYFDLGAKFPRRRGHDCDGGHASYSFRFRRE